ncbi:hypothetical protein SAMN05428959_1011152 [Duganella sp. CF517]|uniref:hypothetical protein n=1 Tax=Duganella sp. CF517 TaxID=1881038 RepID=UPI0008AFA373|nr:hypothetical protein [Duganella sp. CF517]SEN31812.1 hypothetical protein SAMN05428959_1011152 [Duganella sp. CF517]
MNSSTTTAAGADFTQLSAHALLLAAQHGMEIVGNAAGFAVYKDDDFLTEDCTSSEIEQWLEGYDSGKVDESAHNVTRFTDVEFQRIMDHVLYRNWSLVADHSGVKIIGPHFIMHAASYEAFESFIYGFNAAGAALGMLGTDHAPDQDEDGAE